MKNYWQISIKIMVILMLKLTVHLLKLSRINILMSYLILSAGEKYYFNQMQLNIPIDYDKNDFLDLIMFYKTWFQSHIHSTELKIY